MYFCVVAEMRQEAAGVLLRGVCMPLVSSGVLAVPPVCGGGGLAGQGGHRV